MIRAAAAHWREALGLTVRAAPFTCLPPAFLALALAAGAAGVPGLPAVGPAMPLSAYMAAGLAVGAAAAGAFLAAWRLLADLDAAGLLREALGAPVGGAALALSWLSGGTLAGTAGGAAVLLAAGPAAGLPVEPVALLPLAATAALFGGAGLLARLALPVRWGLGLQLYLVPLLALGAAAPAGAGPWRHLILLDPAWAGAAALRGLLAGGEDLVNPLVLLAAVLALAVGLWGFLADTCRRGTWLRTG